jgi:hypothetical protein
MTPSVLLLSPPCFIDKHLAGISVYINDGDSKVDYTVKVGGLTHSIKQVSVSDSEHGCKHLESQTAPALRRPSSHRSLFYHQATGPAAATFIIMQCAAQC